MMKTKEKKNERDLFLRAACRGVAAASAEGCRGRGSAVKGVIMGMINR